MNRFAILTTALLLAASVYAQSPTTPTLIGQLPAVPKGADQLQMNFRGAPLDTVLDYLSRSAGFIVIKEASLSGNIDVVSHQPLSRDEAVALLNTVLNEKGYAAIRNDRMLTIVTREEAIKRNIPVRVGNDPNEIPKSDEMVTQVIPVRYANAQELLNSIQQLLPEYATISANTSSNALVLTDTQSGVRRIAEIVQALDQSISEISELRVFQLKYADAKETAELVQSVFELPEAGRSSGRSAQFEQMIARFRGGPDGDGGRDGGRSGGSTSSGDSAALRAASRVAAEADERTNSLVVSAPEELMPMVDQLVKSIDTAMDVDTVVRVFPLQFSDATEMAATITSIFGEQGQSQSSRGGFGGFSRFAGPSRGGSSSNANLSERRLAERTVLAVADTRTNSVIASSVVEVMDQIAGVILALDQNPAKTKRVYQYSLKNANPEEVTSMLQGMFGGSGSGSSNQRTNNNQSNRQGSTGSGTRTGNSNNSSNSGGSRTGTTSR